MDMVGTQAPILARAAELVYQAPQPRSLRRAGLLASEGDFVVEIRSVTPTAVSK